LVSSRCSVSRKPWNRINPSFGTVFAIWRNICPRELENCAGP
jgi:hypothetical protein